MKILHIARLMAIVGFAAIAGTFLTACEPSTKKLDEAIFYEGPRFKLKLVRYKRIFRSITPGKYLA